MALPPLDAAQAAAYVRARLGAARAARAVPLVFSPDALLLLTRRAGGSLGRLDLLAENMLVLAGSERRRAVTSWHALAASEQQPWLASGPPPGLAQPAGWPTPQAAAAIAEARREAGLPPWPRDPGRAAP